METSWGTREECISPGDSPGEKPLKAITWECTGSLLYKRVSDLPVSPDPGHNSDWSWQCKRKQEWNWRKGVV